MTQGRHNGIFAGHFRFGQDAIPHVGVERTGTGTLADGRQQRFRHSSGQTDRGTCSEAHGAGTDWAGAGQFRDELPTPARAQSREPHLVTG
jgi:hypothetical protein